MTNYKSIIAYLGQSKYREYGDAGDRFISDKEIYTIYKGEAHWSKALADKYEGKLFKVIEKFSAIQQMQGIWGYLSRSPRKGFVFANHSIGEIEPEIPGDGTGTQFTLFDTKTGNVVFCKMPKSNMEEAIKYLGTIF